MSIRFDHVQQLPDIRLILGEATSEISRTAPITSQEFYRSLVDPGFAGTIETLEVSLWFERYSSASQSVTWAAQVRSVGQSAWTTIKTATETWAGYAPSKVVEMVEAASLGVNTAVPLEFRVVVTAATAATVSIRIGTYTPAIRIVGASV